MANLLTINGWGQPADGLATIAPDAVHLDYRGCHDFAATDALIAARMPEADCAIGWSLGGGILRHAVASGALKVKRLILLAPPIQFVADDACPHGMDRTTFDLFRENYANDPLRTAGRFVGLIAKGDRRAKDLVAEHPAAPESGEGENWLPWLDILAEQSFDLWLKTAFPQTLLIQGNDDAVVSPHPAEMLAGKDHAIALWRLADCCHAPHWHDPEGVREAIERFRYAVA